MVAGNAIRPCIIIFIMETHPAPLMISADRMDQSIIVTFSDGMSALYSASLLYAMLPQAEQLDRTQPEE
jgi:hypothetical protein